LLGALGYVFSFLLCFMLILGCADNQPVSGAYPSAGLATWYLAKRTATGEKFDADALTCAIRKTDFGKYYKVCNAENNRCVVVRHNNFGPSRSKFIQGRIIDLSRGAFLRIADLEKGVIKVTVTEEAPSGK